MLRQLALVNLRILTRLLVQKELQGREQECREFRNLNVRFMIFREKRSVTIERSLMKPFNFFP